MTGSRISLGVMVAGGLALAAAPSAVSAKPPTIYYVSGVGTWISDLEGIPTPTGSPSGTAATEYSADSTSMSFYFDIAKTFTYTTSNGGFTVPTTAPATDLTHFSYTLGGALVPTSLSPTLAPDCTGAGVLCSVEFFSTADQQGGALGLDFGDYTVEFVGADFGSTGTLEAGVYPVIMNMDYTENGGTVINEGSGVITIGALPEPASWALMLIGFGGVGAALRTGDRKPHAA